MTTPTPITAVPTPALVTQLRAAADDRRFAGADPHDDQALLREAADRLERAESPRRRILKGGGL